jgi:hypothetical protein
MEKRTWRLILNHVSCNFLPFFCLFLFGLLPWIICSPLCAVVCNFLVLYTLLFSVLVLLFMHGVIWPNFMPKEGE